MVSIMALYKSGITLQSTLVKSGDFHHPVSYIGQNIQQGRSALEDASSNTAGDSFHKRGIKNSINQKWHDIKSNDGN